MRESETYTHRRHTSRGSKYCNFQKRFTLHLKQLQQEQKEHASNNVQADILQSRNLQPTERLLATRRLKQENLETTSEEDNRDIYNDRQIPASENSDNLQADKQGTQSGNKLLIQVQNENSDVAFSNEQRNYGSLKKCFLDAKKADFHKMKNRRWQYYMKDGTLFWFFV